MLVLRAAVVMALRVVPVAAGFDCGAASQWNGTCYDNKPGRIGETHTAASPGDCCAICHDTHKCASWTWWGGTNCNVFDSVGPAKNDSNCVSGDGTPAPPAPPTPGGWVPPPPPGPICQDCPSIVFSLTGTYVGAHSSTSHHGTRVKQHPALARSSARVGRWLAMQPPAFEAPCMHALHAFCMIFMHFACNA